MMLTKNSAERLSIPQGSEVAAEDIYQSYLNPRFLYSFVVVYTLEPPFVL
jgi:hypothetical protein